MLQTNVWPVLQLPYGVAVEGEGAFLIQGAYYPLSRPLLNEEWDPPNVLLLAVYAAYQF